ncbi:MAG: amino acid adenylation domain-containing protein, partial [Gemmatimonadetes bacterium]|nr:amino acid adenylation domain-containing protein [Gemmatimonadota bacterium]
DQLEPGSAAYNLPAVVRLRGRLDADALRWSLDEVVRRHEALRTVFREVDGAPAQVMVPAAGLALPELDLRPLDADARSAALGRHVRDEAARPFDLAAGPLMRAALLWLDGEEAVLLVTMHHIVSDGWSMRVLVREVAALYEARVTNQPSPLADMAVQYADYAAWQRAWLAGAVLEERLAYWRARLAGAPPVLELPTDYPRPAVQGRRGERTAMVLPRPLVDALQALSRQEGATLFMTLLAAFKALLARQAGQDDVVVGTPVANRTRTEAEGLIGFFVNTLALRTDLSGAPSFRELLARVRETTLGAYVNQDVPFERVLEELRPERTLSHAPVFQVFFNLMNLEEHEVQLPGLTLEPVLEEADAHSKFDLTLYAQPHADGMSLTLVYDACLFGEARMAEMLAQYRMLLEQAAGEPEAAIPSFSLVSDGARAQLPDPALPLDDGWMGSVPAVFAARAAEAPERLAAEDAAERWTYGELDARSNQLARFLAGGGVQAGDVVAVYGHRSASLVWALMGILKAGAAFVVLDPSYPPARLQQYLRGSEPRAWLRVEAAGEPPVELEPSLPACRLTLPGRAAAEAAGLLAEWPAEPLPVEIGPDSLAYLSFTSGTTGVPKAVMGRHGSLTHFVPWLVETFGLHAGDRFSMLSGIAHDPLQRDVFTPLQLGAAVCAPPEAALEVPGGLARWMRDAEVSVAHLTPSMGKVITDLPAGAEAERVPSLRLAYFVGEALTRGEVSRLRALAPNVRVVNYYGSTETQRAVAWFDAVADEAGAAGAREVIPLGRGIRDVQLLVLNGAGALAGVGEVGEIHVRSPHVALGYRGDAELTEQRFLPAPFAASPGDRMYRTGDLGRYRPDGVVEPLGRADQQVKVRGFRVELGEIEALLASHPAVREAVVAAREDMPGERRLVAYVVAAPGCEALDAAGLRAYLRERVPEHMVPAAFVALDALPLTPNAKVDRRALPTPPEVDGGAAGAAPLSATEEIVAGIFADVLGMERVGAHEDFFALGGHSLLATRVATRARAAFGTELPLRVFFQSPTPAGLAEWLDVARAGPGREHTPIARVSRDGAVLPLSFAQQRLWAVNQMESESRVYNQGFGFRLRGRLDVRALEQAMTELTRRHAVFRTRFVERDGVPGQVIDPPRPVPLPVVDLSGLEDREAVLARLARDHTAELFDLGSGVLLRLLLVRLAEDEHALLVVMHHITCDGWSMGIIRRDVAVLYHAFAEGRPSPLPEPAIQYADYAVWQRAWLSEEREREQLGFWRDRLEAAAPLYLATDRTRAEGTDGETRHFGLPSELSDGVRRLSHALGATPFMTLLAAFQVLLRWQGAGEDVVVGTDVANRNLRTETEDVVGFFVNQLVLRTSLGGNPAFGELVERVREVTLAAYDHQDLPFERVVAALQPRRAAGETPFFRVKFAMQTVPGGTEPVALPGLVLEPLVPERTGAQVDVLLSVFDTGDHLRGLWEYRTSLFSTQLIDRWTRRYQDVLQAAVADPGLRLDALRARLDAEEVRGGQGAQEALKERRRARFARP